MAPDPVVTPRAGRRLDPSLLPMRLWEKAKIHGAWNPADIDYATDRRHWLALPDRLCESLRQLCAIFRAGEEAVTLRLPPLLHIVASEGRFEETLYLTSFLWEEAKHVDLFNRFFADVCYETDLARYDHPSYRRIFDVELRESMERLLTDRSPEAQVSAAATYHLVVEGVMADTGYYLFRRILRDADTLPGMRRAIGLLHRDESRHIAFGVYFLSRLIVEHGDRAYKALLDRMKVLKPLTEDATREFVRSLEHADTGIGLAELTQFSQQRFSTRIQRIVRARTQCLEDLHAVSAADPEGEDDNDADADVMDAGERGRRRASRFSEV